MKLIIKENRLFCLKTASYSDTRSPGMGKDDALFAVIRLFISAAFVLSKLCLGFFCLFRNLLVS